MCVCVCVVLLLFVCFVFVFCIILYVNCFGRTVLYICIEYHIWVNMCHVSAQGVDERMINVHYYYCASNIYYSPSSYPLGLDMVNCTIRG